MATTGDSANPQPFPPAAAPAAPPQQQQQPSSAIPQYPELIMGAIETLNEKEGSSMASISKQIESTHPDLPAAHPTLLSHHLNKMKQSGQLVMTKNNNYMKPDPNAPPKRGRGRPPKPKTPLPPGTVAAPSRPRGRPPKAKDPFAPVVPPKKKISGGSGRPRGRPPKNPKTTIPTAPAAAPSAAAPPAGQKRGRGRPPKVKPAVTPVAG